MNKIIKNLSLALLGTFLLIPNVALAHQPRLVSENSMEIGNPEISQAFYGELLGEPAEYRINSNEDFSLYVEILVPDIENVSKDLSVEISLITDGKTETLALLDGSQFEWTPFFEEFARDNYFEGPKFKSEALPGEYLIKVSSPNNQGKYSLVVGELEKFPPLEIMNSLIVVPQLKLHFFNEPLLKVIFSPFVLAYIFLMYLLAFVFGFLYRVLLRKFAKKSPHGVMRNIGSPGRLLRFGLGIGLLVLAIATSWSPFLLFFSGFCLFEAIFSWCGFYAAIGKNTCPLI